MKNKKLSRTMKKKYRDGELQHLKRINVWSCGSEKAKKSCRDKIAKKAKLRFAAGKGNFHWDDEDWKTDHNNKLKKTWKNKMKSGFKPYNFGVKRDEKTVDKIRETVIKRIEEGRIIPPGKRKYISEKENKRKYRIISEKRRVFLKNHPEQSVVARIFAAGGKNIGTSIQQENIYAWSINKFRGERIEYNYPFRYAGRYAFGDVVFVDRSLVIEYDGWAKTEEKRRSRRFIIENNAFDLVELRKVCFDEIEAIVNSHPIKMVSGVFGP